MYAYEFIFAKSDLIFGGPPIFSIILFSFALGYILEYLRVGFYKA